MRHRKGRPWRPADEYGRSLTGLSINLIVPDIAACLPFFGDVLGLAVLYSDEDFAALAGPDGAQIMLHAEHTYEHMPLLAMTRAGARGLGVEIRLLGVDPDRAERAARRMGATVLVAARTYAHGWRECHLLDPNGYVFVVGLPTDARDGGAAR